MSTDVVIPHTRKREWSVIYKRVGSKTWWEIMNPSTPENVPIASSKDKTKRSTQC